MNTESPAAVLAAKDSLDNCRRLFHAHVGAVVFTAALVIPLLLGVTSIPSWVSVAYCVVIAVIAIAFVAAAAKNMRSNCGVRVSNRFECLIVTVALSMLQAIFIVPVLICVYAPTLRL